MYAKFYISHYFHIVLVIIPGDKEMKKKIIATFHRL